MNATLGIDFCTSESLYGMLQASKGLPSSQNPYYTLTFRPDPRALNGGMG